MKCLNFAGTGSHILLPAVSSCRRVKPSRKIALNSNGGSKLQGTSSEVLCFTTSSIQPCTVSGVRLSIPALQHHPSSPAQFRAWSWLYLLYSIIHPALHGFGREVVYPCFTTSSIQTCTVSGSRLSIPALQHHPSSPARFRAWGCLSLLTTSSIQPCTVSGVRLFIPALQHHQSSPAQFRAWGCLSLLYNIIHPALHSFRREVVYPCFSTSSIQLCTVLGVRLSIPALQHHSILTENNKRVLSNSNQFLKRESNWNLSIFLCYLIQIIIYSVWFGELSSMVYII